ncbi:MAG TPA: hypothetical protein PLL20_10665 [Phycisphaerae bacterium]|nr:hypothetical protein [Phycisphaerae bacterium]
MDSEEAVSGQQSAISSDVAHLPVDARCPHCGYSLRGLPENRCPECGRPFEVTELTQSFRPRWPQLLTWYLAACVIATILDLSPALLRWNAYLLLPHGTAAEPLRDVVNVASLVKTALILAVGPICIVGLIQRRDWARKGCVLIFTVSLFASLSYLHGIQETIGATSGLREAVSATLPRLALLARGLEPALVVLFTLTGLRRKTLIRKGRPQPSLPPPGPSLIRRDWPLLIAMILLGLGVALAGYGWLGLHAMKQISRYLGIAVQAQGADLLEATAKIHVMLGLLTMAASAVIWLRPSLTRLLTIAVACTLVSVRVLEFIAYQIAYAPEPLWALCSALRIVATLTPCLALVLFAFLPAGREDIRRLEAKG